MNLLAVLETISVLKGLKKQTLEQVAGLAEARTAVAGSSIILQGEPTRGLFVLADGVASVFRTDLEGQMLRMATLETGAFFAELSLFDPAPRTVTIMAETTCSLLHIDATDLEAYLLKIPELDRCAFYQIAAADIASRFRDLNMDYMVSQQMLWKQALSKST